MLAYVMLLAALSNAVCLHNASFFAIDLCKYFLFHALSSSSSRKVQLQKSEDKRTALVAGM